MVKAERLWIKLTRRDKNTANEYVSSRRNVSNETNEVWM